MSNLDLGSHKCHRLSMLVALGVVRIRLTASWSVGMVKQASFK